MSKKGFTIIELLVVIAIVGVLSSVILGNLNGARGKSTNTAIKSNLANARAQAELYYDVNGANGYLGICQPTAISVESVRRFFDAAHAISGATNQGFFPGNPQTNRQFSNCRSSASAWVISVPLKDPEIVGPTTYNYYCVDSTGTSAVKTNPLTNGAIVCPAN